MPDPYLNPDLEAAKELAWREVAAIDAALAAGRIDRAGWHDAMRALVEPAYLAAATAEAGSGHSGDAAEWEASRRIVMTAVDRPGSFLDVGCANGLLMESVHHWGTEDGHRIEPYGLDISPALADLARRRCPQWADRIWAANAADWTPPGGRRFSYVRTAVEYVPDADLHDYLARLLRVAVEPGGRLIVGKQNEESAAPSYADRLAAAGFAVAGRTRWPHPRHRELVYSVCWIEAASGS